MLEEWKELIAPMRVKPWWNRKPVKIAIVGEAPGQKEMNVGMPFVGASGDLLNELLDYAKISRDQCYITNVFDTQPPADDLLEWCVGKRELPNEGKHWPVKALAKGKYLRPEWMYVRERLEREIRLINPNLIIALGNSACWALLNQTGINKLRGKIHESIWSHPDGTPFKVLPSYHPAAVLRVWSYRAILATDLLKAVEEQEYPEIEYPRYNVLVPETPSEIREWFTGKDGVLAFDIETAKGQVTWIGFAFNKEECLVIPFVKNGWESYWSLENEIEVHGILKSILEGPLPKLAHNGLYDVQWLYRVLKIKTMNYLHDTMILHHSLEPELRKSLDFLASIYTNAQPWKSMRHSAETSKRDDE